MWDATTLTVIGALDGLSLRSDVRAHNIANAETPGFRASHVDFETSLADAVRRGSPEIVQANIGPSPTVINALGNSVDLETELIGELKDGLHREAMTAAFNFKVGNMKVAMGGHR
jgi:flagellar basal-body rod protein FlgB